MRGRVGGARVQVGPGKGRGCGVGQSSHEECGAGIEGKRGLCWVCGGADLARCRVGFGRLSPLMHRACAAVKAMSLMNGQVSAMKCAS